MNKIACGEVDVSSQARILGSFPERVGPRYTASTLKSRITPAVVAGAAMLVTIGANGVPPTDIARYGLYLAITIIAPGVLLWRLLGGPTRTFATDIAAGTALGFCIELGWYLLLSGFELQHLAGLWSLAVLGASALWPRLRKCWGLRRDPQPVALSWIMSLGVSFSTFLFVGSFQASPIAVSSEWAFPEAAYVDMPFHQALAGGALTQFPPNVPYVIDEPLKYQFFVYEHLAAATTVTGIDLTWVVYRLYSVPFTAILVVVIAGFAWALTARLFAAGIATIWTVLANPLGVLPTDSVPAYATALASPTQVYGSALFAPLVLVVIALSRNGSRNNRAGLWTLFVVFALTATGGKGTFIPLLMASLSGALVLRLLIARRVDRTLTMMLVLSVAAFFVEYLLVLRGFGSGLGLSPADSIGQLLQLEPTADTAALMWGGGLLIGSFLLPTAAALWLLTDREIRVNSTFLFLISLCGAGIAVTLLTSQSGVSQVYFAKSVWPYLGILTAWGIAVSLSVTRSTAARLGTTVFAGMIVGGAVAAWALGSVDPAQTYRYELLKVLAIVAAVSLAILGIIRMVRRDHPVGGDLLAGATALACGLSLTGGSLAASRLFAESLAGDTSPATSSQPIPTGGSQLAVSLRNRSSSTDLVATNAHCRLPQQEPLAGDCDARHFWITALTQRQTLVEGWAYTASAYESATTAGVPLGLAPFWDRPMLRDNDQVFYKPTRKSIERFTAEYGVRWLFVDRTTRRESPELSQFAELVEENPEAAIYDLQPAR